METTTKKRAAVLSRIKQLFITWESFFFQFHYVFLFVCFNGSIIFLKMHDSLQH